MVYKTILRLAEGIQFPNALTNSKDEIGPTDNNQVLPSEFESRLKEIIGPFELERYPARRNLKQSYQRRINSLSKAFLFILDTIPQLNETKQKLQDFLRYAQHIYELPDNKSIDEYQDILAEFTAFLLGGLTDHYPYKVENSRKIKEAIELLNQAEQYVIMKEGKADLATLIPITVNKSITYALRYEKQIEPYTQESLKEFEAIKKASLVTPKWFRSFPSPLQIYLLASPNVEPEDKTPALSIQKEFNEFIKTWDTIRTKHSVTLADDLSSIANKKLPEWFKQLPSHQQQLLQHLISMKKDGSGIAADLNTYKDELETVREYLGRLSNLKPLPYWYLYLERYEQRFLIGALNSKTRIEDAISFLPSRLRRLPLPANICESHLVFLNEKLKVAKKYDAGIRLSHFCSRDMQDAPVQLQELYSHRNLARLVSMMGEHDIFLFMQTLISPVAFLKYYMPDYYLNEQRKKIISEFQDNHDTLIFASNHAVNIAKYAQFKTLSTPDSRTLLDLTKIILLVKDISTLPKWTLKEIEKELSLAFDMKENKSVSSNTEQESPSRRHLSDLFKKHKDLLSSFPHWQKILSRHLYFRQNCITKEQIDEYYSSLNELKELTEVHEDALNSEFGSATIFDHKARELFLSSVGHLSTMTAKGKPTGSCVSGKDRKDIETTHTLAMIAYREKRGRWPRLSDTGDDRKEFVELVAEMEVSGHGDEHAGQNAPGCEGKKHPDEYWPKDIADAIRQKLNDRDALINSDILATNNEVKNIVNSKGVKVKSLIKPDFSNCIIAAQNLTQEKRLELLTSLKLILGEEKFLNSRTNTTTKIVTNVMANVVANVVPAVVTTQLLSVLSLFSQTSKESKASKTTKESEATKATEESQVPKTTEESNAPKGIKRIKEIINAPGTDELTSTSKVIHVLWEILLRPNESWKRDDDIQTIYTAVKLLLKEPCHFEETMQTLSEIKTLSFSTNSNTPIPV